MGVAEGVTEGIAVGVAVGDVVGADVHTPGHVPGHKELMLTVPAILLRGEEQCPINRKKSYDLNRKDSSLNGWHSRHGNMSDVR